MNSIKISGGTILLRCWTVVFAVSLVVTVSGQNLQQQTLRGHVPAAISKLSPLGRQAGVERLRLAIGLPFRNQDDLNNLLHEIYDPASPKFHHYLTPEEFNARFGPAEEDYQAVVEFAKRNNFTITATRSGRAILDVEGSVTDIEKAFHVSMNVYQHPREARLFHAPNAEPTLDLAVPILHISGLDDYSLPRPNHTVRPLAASANATPQSGSGPGGTYRGNDFRAAYGVGPLTGSGQSVGLVQFDGYHASDIAAYESQAGLPNVTLVNVAVDGGVSFPDDTDGEVDLDIEMVMSMAPGISKIIVYEAPNPSPWVDMLSAMADDNSARQLSCSWGGGSPDASSEQQFQKMAAQGQSFFNATGDSDAFTSAIEFPSDSTNITQVGATTLSTTGPGGSYVSERVWNWGLDQGSYVGSSGGVSTFYSIPIYQQGISMSANQGSTSMRNVPDVALTGDNVYVTYGNGTNGSFGGTSCAAPLWAGLTALINQQAAASGLAPVGFMNPTIYAIGKSNPNYSSIFHDVTTGNNFSGSSPTKYSAVAGYDLCTGWGTPVVTNLINALEFVPVIVGAGSTLAMEGCMPTNGAIDSGETVTVNFSLKNVGSANTTNLVATLLATNGVILPGHPQTYGALVAGGSTVTQAFSFTALGSCGGTILPTFQLQDGAVNLGTVSFSLSLGTLQASFLQNFDSVTAPALPTGWTTSHGGGDSGWITKTTTSDTAPNAAFSSDASSTGSNALTSANITLPSGSISQLTFRNSYNLESVGTSAFDGGVLEIKIGSGSFADIFTAGGTFLSGAYNHTISSSSANPLRGRLVWSGNSGGFITTAVNLPAAASGQTIQLRWRCGTDGSGTSGVGWYIDSIAISNLSCCAGSVADVAVSNSVSPTVLNLTSNLTLTLNVTNLGPDAASFVTVTDALPAGLTFISASASQGTWTNSGSAFTASLGVLTNKAKATITIQATATAAGQWTNKASASSSAVDPNSTNNTAAASLLINSPPTISAMTNVVTDENVSVGPIAFTINDAETAASSLIVSASSSNTNLINTARITLGGSGSNRNVVLAPISNQYGVSTITVAVNDGMVTTTAAFVLTVNHINQSPSLSSVPDFTVLEKSTLTFTNSAADIDQPQQTLTFSLSNAPDGAVVDSNSGFFSWTPSESQGPSTNHISILVTDNGTPAMSSSQSFDVVVLESNEPPVLAPIVNHTIHAGMTLAITNTATDPDLPTNSLTFSLNPAPTGATIDPTNGTFLWTPDSSFTNTTNSVTVVVTDLDPWAVNTQQLSDAKSFTVFVVPPPTLGAVALSNNLMTFTWNSISGLTYRVQYSTDLVATNWSDLLPDVTATDSTASKSDAIDLDAQRFYRVLVLP